MIKKTEPLKSGDLKVPWNLAAPKANLYRCSAKHSCSEKFPKIHRKRPVQESPSKTPCNFIRKETLAQMVSFEFWQFFKNMFLAERLQMTASAPWKITQEIHKTYH